MIALREDQFAMRRGIVDRWRNLPDDLLEADACRAVEALDGCYIPPGGEWGPMEHELTLLGITATGNSLANAARSWMKRAKRVEAFNNRTEEAVA
jgi:hypothetical protein